MLAHFADPANDTHGPLVLRVVLGAIECALLMGCAAVDWRVAGSADLELSELVVLYLHRITGIALALSLGSPGLLGS